MSDMTDLVFVVLEGPSTGTRIALSGRSKPYSAGSDGSVSFGREQRIKETYYPGNPNPSQQVIGPQYKPTTFNGIWKDRYLGIGAAQRLVETFEALCAQGCTVQVLWEFRLYQGIIGSFEWKPGDPTGGKGDIRWEMQLKWSGLGAPIPKKVASSTAGLQSNLARAADALAGLGGALVEISNSLRAFVGQLRTTSANIHQALVDSTNALSSPLVTLATLAGRLGIDQSMTGRLAEGGLAAINGGTRTAGDASEILAAVFPADALVTDDPDLQLLASLARYDAIDLAFKAVTDQETARVALEALSRPPQFAEVIPVIGSDLRAIASRFYGNADLWNRIARQNGLTSSQIPAGIDRIIVPLDLSDATDNRIL